MNPIKGDMCPLCKGKAEVHHAQMKGYPESRAHVICPHCGSFHILEALLYGSSSREKRMEKVDLSQMNWEKLRDENHKAIYDDRTIIWIDQPSQWLTWQAAIDRIEKEQGWREHEVRVLPDFIAAN